MIRTITKKVGGSAVSIAIPIIGAVAIKIFDAENPRSFTSVYRFLKGFVLEEAGQEMFQMFLDWVW